jgi:lipopolysaccharide export system protein LptC
VQVEQSGGYKFATNDATIDTNTGQVIGQTIKGNGPSGAVQSNSYAVTDKGDRMVFKGGVRARLNEH